MWIELNIQFGHRCTKMYEQQARTDSHEFLSTVLTHCNLYHHVKRWFKGTIVIWKFWENPLVPLLKSTMVIYIQGHVSQCAFFTDGDFKWCFPIWFSECAIRLLIQRKRAMIQITVISYNRIGRQLAHFWCRGHKLIKMSLVEYFA